MIIIRRMMVIISRINHRERKGIPLSRYNKWSSFHCHKFPIDLWASILAFRVVCVVCGILWTFIYKFQTVNNATFVTTSQALGSYTDHHFLHHLRARLLPKFTKLHTGASNQKNELNYLCLRALMCWLLLILFVAWVIWYQNTHQALFHTSDTSWLL